MFPGFLPRLVGRRIGERGALRLGLGRSSSVSVAWESVDGVSSDDVMEMGDGGAELVRLLGGRVATSSPGVVVLDMKSPKNEADIGRDWSMVLAMSRL